MMVVLVVPITDDGVGCADAEAARAEQVIIQTSSSPECFLEVCFRRFFLRKRADTSSLPARLQWLENTDSCCFAFRPPIVVGLDGPPLAYEQKTQKMFSN